MKGADRPGRGQAVLGVILAVALGGVAWEVLGVTWSAVTARVTLQDSLDAGATTGAAVLADGLNTLAITNGALLALGSASLLGLGEGAAWASEIQRFQDEVIQRTPGLARTASWTTAVALGATVAKPSGSPPSLMVRRVYFLPWVFGSRFPLWMADDLRPTAGQRWGRRVVSVEGWKTVRWGTVTVPLAASARAAATWPRSASSSWPMLVPGWDSRLIPLD